MKRVIVSLAIYTLIECAFLLVAQWTVGGDLSALSPSVRFGLVGANLFLALPVTLLLECFGREPGLRSDLVDHILGRGR